MDNSMENEANSRAKALRRMLITWLLIMLVIVPLSVAAHHYGPGLVNKILTQNPRQLFVKARKMYDQHNYQGALEIMLDALNKSPSNHRYHFLTSLCYSSLDENPKAMEHLNQAITNCSEDFEDKWRYYARRGDLASSMGRPDQAISDWTASVALNKDNARVYFNLAQNHANRQEYGEALNFIAKAINLDENNVDYLYQWGNYWMAEKNWGSAVYAYKRVLELDAEHVPTYFKLGISLQRTGKLPEAEVYITEYLKYRPDDKDARQLARSVKRQLKR
jgi:tetratricopeptide (TPR) repeat protein